MTKTLFDYAKANQNLDQNSARFLSNLLCKGTGATTRIMMQKALTTQMKDLPHWGFLKNLVQRGNEWLYVCHTGKRVEELLNIQTSILKFCISNEKAKLKEKDSLRTLTKRVLSKSKGKKILSRLKFEKLNPDSVDSNKYDNEFDWQAHFREKEGGR